MDHIIRDIVLWLQMHVSAELLTIMTFGLCAIAILGLLRFYGLLGLYVYNAMALVVANIQVLRLTTFEHFSEPVALGTVLFSTTFFVNDLISEHYGPKMAIKCVTIGFWIQLLMVFWMVLTLGHPVISSADNTQSALMQLFTPSLRIFVASIIAYWCSQWLDVFIFARLRTITKGKFLWLRQNVSMFVAGFVDTLIFSALAWRWFSETPYAWGELFITFVISAQIIRFFINLAATPFMYLSYRYIRHDTIQQPV